jgi:DNA-binding MarR family transcriptional regulator
MDKNQEFATQMMKIIEQLFFIEKNNTFIYGTELRLYPSEIHLILLIDEGHTSNSTEMANKLRVTKGAVSQTISRLVKKNILEKSKDPHKRNELTVSFTPLGEKVIKECRRLQTFYKSKFVAYSLSLSRNDQDVINQFLCFLTNLLNTSENKTINE